ncbi:MAG TPA: endolytic transglycosylase MltG [Dehalococcoidia bacterium]|nr:endolytic transglycosylase MltG [Dehalococcoidia bacterium]
MTTSALNSAFFGIGLAAVIVLAGWVIKDSPSSISKRAAPVRVLENAETVFIEVKPGDNAADIGRRLEAAGVIQDASSFSLLARATGAERGLAAGEYEFEQGTSVVDALSRIRKGLTAARVVTIPEGLRIEEVAGLLERRGIVRGGDFLAALGLLQATPANGSSLLAARPPGAGLEGYVYPATYSFSRRATAGEVAAAMLRALEERFTPEMREKARQLGLTPHEVITLASIIEREIVVPGERPLVASVYLNRLRMGIALQADPTVQYAVGPPPGTLGLLSYWKRELTAQDLQSQSPYNTYARPGLPPGPIANPGIDSILAVLNPAQTSFLYFVAKPDGSHAFSATFEEHQRNVQLYQR